MNIEIADEKIERMAQLAIHSRVDEWFNMGGNRYVIRDYIREYVKAYVQQEISVYKPDMKELIKGVQAERFAEQLTTGIATEIAKEFCDRHGG